MTVSSKLSEYQYQIGDLGAYPTTSGAFDGNISGGNSVDGTWYPTITVGTTNYKNTGVIGQDFQRDVIITTYKLYIHPTLYSTYNDSLPKSWTFEGWNGSSWVVLDTKSDYASSLVSGWNTISISNTNRYTKYRLNITSNNGNTLYLTITELEFWGYDYIEEQTKTDLGNLYIESDEIDGSADIVDSSEYNNTLLTFGNTHHSTDEYKIGTSSIYFDGSSNIEIDVTTEDLFFSSGRSIFATGAIDFTIDCWVNCASSMEIFSLGSSGSGSGTTATYRQGLVLSIAYNRVYLTAGNLSIDGSSGYMSYHTAGIIQNNEWTHIAVVSAGNQPIIFINGVSQTLYTGLYHGSNTFENTKLYVPRHINIGSAFKYNGVTDTTFVSASGFSTGYIDSYRIVRGRAMWTENFTPPTIAYSAFLPPTQIDFNFTEINYTPPIYNDILFWFAPVKEISLVSNSITTSFSISYAIEANISNVIGTNINVYSAVDKVISFIPNGVNLVITSLELDMYSDSFNAYTVTNTVDTGLSLDFGYDRVISFEPNIINTGMSITPATDVHISLPIYSIISIFGFTPQITATIQNNISVGNSISDNRRITSKFQYINYIGSIKSICQFINNINDILNSKYQYINALVVKSDNEFSNSILMLSKNEFLNNITSVVKSKFEFHNSLLNIIKLGNEFINTFYIKSHNEFLNDITATVKSKHEYSNNFFNIIKSENEFINTFYIKSANEFLNDITSIIKSTYEFSNLLGSIIKSENEFVNTFYIRSENEFIDDIISTVKSKYEYNNLLSNPVKATNEFVNTFYVKSKNEFLNYIDISISSKNEYLNDLTVIVKSDQEFINDILSYNPIVSSYKYVNNLQDETAIINTNTISCYVNGQEIEVYSFDLSIDDDSYCYSFSAELNTLEDWFLCVPDTNLIFTVNSVVYHLKLDSRNRTREFGDEKLQIEARSKTSILGEGNDNTITKTWDGMFVRDIISEVCFDNGIDFTYSMPNWFIQEGLLTSNAETPISLMQRLIEACGGLIVCNNLGVLNFIPKYPVCPTLYDTYVSKISDYDNIFSISETKEINNKWNSVIVSNIEDATDYSYSISEINDIEDDPYTKHIRVKVYPYLQNIDLLTSYISNDIVIVSYENPIEETIIDEYVGIIEGQGSTSESVKSIISYQYLNQDLGTIEFDNNNLVTQTAGQSLLKITYTTEYHDFLIHSFGVERIQVYTTDENEEL